jgi:predicted NUDIX family phosphoesterase
MNGNNGHMDTRVLVVEANLLYRVGQFSGYTLDVERYLQRLLSSDSLRFMHRDVAESDTNFKQIIPYVVLRYGECVFNYVRGKRSSESRLIAQRSIGVGGHIEPSDQSLFSSDREMYLAAARREVNEEVKLDTMYRENVVALINDDSTDVGKVHLGIMHIWDIAEPKVTKREGLITQAGFVAIEELKKNINELETWSRIALQVLEDPKVATWDDIMADRVLQELKPDL